MAAESLYMVANSTRPTTAASVKQPTGAAIRTMLQLATTSTDTIYIAEWGISFDGSAAGTPIQVELFGCTGAATLGTALAATDIHNVTTTGASSTLIPASSALQFSTSLSAFATAANTEGTVANYRGFDLQLIAPTSQYVKQFPLGREPFVPVSSFVRIRVTAASTVNCYCYIVFGES